MISCRTKHHITEPHKTIQYKTLHFSNRPNIVIDYVIKFFVKNQRQLLTIVPDITAQYHTAPNIT